MLSSRELRLREGLQERAACTSFKPSAPYRTNKAVASLFTSIWCRADIKMRLRGDGRMNDISCRRKTLVMQTHTHTYTYTHMPNTHANLHTDTRHVCLLMLSHPYHTYLLTYAHPVHYIHTHQRTSLMLIHEHTHTQTPLILVCSIKPILVRADAYILRIIDHKLNAAH